MKHKKSLKQLIAELEEITAWFEGDDIDIEKANDQFERATVLAEQIKIQLADSKNQIKIIKQKFNL